MASTVQEMVESEIADDTLTRTGTEDCGCPVYHVTPGRHSQLMGNSDSMVAHIKPCDWKPW